MHRQAFKYIQAVTVTSYFGPLHNLVPGASSGLMAEALCGSVGSKMRAMPAIILTLRLVDVAPAFFHGPFMSLATLPSTIHLATSISSSDVAQITLLGLSLAGGGSKLGTSFRKDWLPLFL